MKTSITLVILLQTNVALCGTLSCPPNIVVTETLAETPPGWMSGTKQGKRALAGATVYDGPISDMLPLVAEGTKSDSKQTWEYPLGAGRDRDVWVRCVYGHSHIVLERNMGRPENCVATELDNRMPGFDFTCTYK